VDIYSTTIAANRKRASFLMRSISFDACAVSRLNKYRSRNPQCARCFRWTRNIGTPAAGRVPMISAAGTSDFKSFSATRNRPTFLHNAGRSRATSVCFSPTSNTKEFSPRRARRARATDEAAKVRIFFSVFNYHYRSVRNVNADFNHRR